MTHLIALILTIAIIAGFSIAGAQSTANLADFRTKQLQREVWRLEKTVAELRKQVNAQGEQIEDTELQVKNANKVIDILIGDVEEIKNG